MKVDDLLPPEIFAPEETNPQILAALDFEQAARFLDLEDWIVNRLRHTARELTVNLPLTRDDGTETTVTGYRVQHGAGGYPRLGPVHLSAQEELHQLRATAMGLTWQMALLELPFAGAAGAIVCDAAQLSERELRIVTREYGAALEGFIGPAADVLAPGAACNAQTMAWMLAGVARDTARNSQVLAAVVGKPAVLWGVDDGGAVAATALAALLRQVCDESAPPAQTRRLPGDPMPRMTVSIQGFGASARALAQRLNGNGARLIGLADASGGLYDAHGLELDAVNRYVVQHGVLFGFAEAEQVSNADIIACECDVLVLDAAAQQVTMANAERVRARVVVEGVNGSITRRAEEWLAQRGIVTIPYLLASAGGAIAAALEWERNLHPTPAPFDVHAVDAYAARLYEGSERLARQHQIDLRRAGMIAAVQRVAAQMRLAGRE